MHTRANQQNSELLECCKKGIIKPHKGIKGFQGKTVEFVDGSTAEIDMIVHATGYHVRCVKPTTCAQQPRHVTT